MNKKIMMIAGLALVIAGGAYKFVLAKPAPLKSKLPGTVYILPKEFLVNMADGHFARLSVALVFKPGYVPEPAGGKEAAPPPDGFGILPQEAAVRDIVTDVVTGADGSELEHKAGREKLKERILKRVERGTDVEATKVLFTDVTVQ